MMQRMWGITNTETDTTISFFYDPLQRTGPRQT